MSRTRFVEWTKSLVRKESFNISADLSEIVVSAVLEVCQFARDASVAEAWLVAQEPYVSSRDLGHTVDEVEKLLKRHEAFEKSTATWEERFSALERLTTVWSKNCFLFTAKKKNISN